MKKNLHQSVCVRVFAICLFVFSSFYSRATDFVVSNSANTGAGSLRQAILDANASTAVPHTITFTVAGIITVPSSLPTITRQVTIDGGNTVTISGPGGNNLVALFVLGAGSNGSTIRNLTMQNTGLEPIRLSVALTGITIENMIFRQTSTHYMNRAILANAAVTNLTIRKVTVTGLEDKMQAIYLGGNVTNVLIDSFSLSAGGGMSARGIHVQGVVNGFTLKNSLIDLDDPATNDDGDYGIVFATTVNNVTIDTTVFRDNEVAAIYCGAGVTNFSLKNSRFDNLDGWTRNKFVLFRNNSNTVTIDKNIFNADYRSGADDGDYGLYLNGGTNQNITITNNQFVENDSLGIYFGAETLGNNHDNVLIKGNTFTRNGNGANASGGINFLARNLTSDGAAVQITENTFTDNNGNAIMVRPGNTTSYVLPNFTISKNIIYNTKSVHGTIRVQYVDKVNITENSIYNNQGLGIELAANTAANCGYEGVTYTPQILSSVETSAGSGVYNITVKMPTICGSGNCSIEVFSNEAGTKGVGGQHFVTRISGLGSGNRVLNGVTGSFPEITSAPYGFWTATLKVTNNCGTSEFSNKKAIKPNGPAGINAGIALWLRGDEISVNNAEPTASGQTITGWEEFSGVGPSATTVINNPLTKLSGINFNPVADMDADGIRGHFAGAPSWITTPTTTTVAVFNPLSTTASGDRLFCLFSQAGSDYNTNAAQIEFYRTGNNIQSYRGSTLLNPPIPGTTGVSALNRPGVFSSVTSATNHTSYYNGNNMGSGNYSKGNFAVSQWFIGTGYNSTDGWSYMSETDFAEVFTYNRVLTATELQRVQSYMALKYGIAMKQNYVLSNGTLVWDVTANAAHSKEIAALARDNVSVLHQKQAKAFHNDEVVTIAVGDALATTNNDKTDTITNNLSVFMWGNDSLATTYTQAFTAGTYSSTRMPRVWKVQKANWADKDITIQVKGAKSNNYLLISNTAAFTTITQELQLSSTGTITLSSSLLADGTYFTIGRQQKAPGGVSTGLGVWTKADEGVTRSGTNAITWEDQSPSQRVWPKVNTNVLTWNSAAMNYNPAIQFPGPGAPANYFVLPQFTASYTQGEIFSVQSSAINNVEGFPWQLGGTSGSTLLSYRTTSNTMTLHWGTNALRSFSFAPKNMALPAILNVNTLSNSWTASLDGKVMSTAAYTTSFAQQGPSNALGVGYGSYFNGPISEIILYNRKLNATERQRVNSYMAIRYGITLDQTTPTDYLASDGTTIMWKASDNTGFASNIAGIGRDEIGSLYQKQSRSINTAATGNLIAVAVGSELAATNAANSDTVINNKSFLVWGDNNGAITYTTNVTGNNVTLRMPRVWKVDKTNWATRDITIKLFGSVSNTYLLISNASGTFSTIDQELPMNPDSTITISSDLLPDGAYFTFGRQIVGPGYVNSNVVTWQRADDGNSTADTWYDYSGNSNNATQVVVADQPGVISGAGGAAMNFNPGYLFTSGVEWFDYTNDLTLNGTGNKTVIWAVKSLAATGTTQAVLSHSGTGTNTFVTFLDNLNRPSVGVGGGGSTCAPISSPGVSFGIPLIGTYNRTSTTSATMYGNAGFPNTSTCNSTFVGQPMRIGARSSSAFNPFNGNISEVVVYNRSLTVAEMQRVHSYLALKYGITLDQTTPADYVATDWDGATGTKMWTASKNGAYNKNIAGIGRDDKTALYQKQSRSASDTLITVAAGSAVAADNASNGAEIEDMSFFTWADDGGAATFSTAVTGVPNATFRMVRVWKVDRTNWSDQTLTFKAAQGGERYLLVNATDPAFGAGTTEYPMSTATGTVSLSSADLPDGAFFTLATKIVGPACVNSGIVAWLRADYASAPNSWADFSGNQTNAAQTTAANQPALLTSGLNYNKALQFNGTTTFQQIPQASLTGKFPTGNAARTVIGVGISTAATDQVMFTYGSYVANQASGLRKNTALAPFFEANGATNINGAAGTLPSNKVAILSGRYTGGTTGTAFVYVNDTSSLASGARDWATTLSAGGAQIGKYVGGTTAAENRYWTGNIGEVIVYNRNLTDDEFQRVSSYLALKYGITLDQSPATDYIASDGTTRMWTATDNTGYNYRITGIGRDDCTDLYQKQSLSVETGGILAMAIGDAVEASNTDNASTIDNNNSYFVFADDNASVLYNTELTGSQDLTVRMQRTWKVDKTNWTDAGITFKLTGGNDKIYMVISADNVFDGTDATYQLDASGNVTVPTDQIQDGYYFTFAKALSGPGYVNVGVQLWMRADDNVSTVDNWQDYSGNDNNAVQATAANQPVFTPNAVNYNPAFNFDGANDYMDFSTNGSISGTNPLTVASVSMRDAVSVGQAILSQQGLINNNFLHYFAAANKYTVGSSGIGSQVSTGTYATANVPYLTSLTRSATNQFSLFTNGAADGGPTTQTWSFTSNNLRIGNRDVTADIAFNGYINETVVYNRELTAAELLRVHSYMALKYGLTKSGDYIATDNTTSYWTAASSVGYTNNIAGIGRDDKTGLYQKQSRSVNTASSGNMVAMGLTSIAATNKDNTAVLSDDLSFLVWGDNGANGTQTTEYPTTLLDPGGCSKITRLQREWRVQKTGTVDDVQLEVNLTGFVNSSTGQSDLKLLMDDDGDFANGGTTVIDPTSYNSSTQTVLFNGLSFGDSQYFTIVTDLTNQAPGGILPNLYTWYRADKGITATTTVSTWADQSASVKNLTAAAAAQPAYNNATNLINFNPTLGFDGTNDFMSNAAISHTAATNGEDVFAVVLPTTVTGLRNVVGMGTVASTTNTTEIRYTTNQLNYGAGAGFTNIVNPTASGGIAQLVNANRANNGAGASLLLNGTSVASGTIAPMQTLTQLNIGARRYNAGNDQFFNGRVAEVAIYNAQLGLTDRYKIASYLAVKYGITLPHNYLDPGGNIIWDATANSGYGNNITGIGRDDCNGLHQKQSKSINAEALVTMGNYTGIYTTNAGNPNSLDNNTALLFGDDNGSRAAWVSTNAPLNRQRITRSWKVQEKGNVSTVTIQVPGSTSASAVKLPLERDGVVYLLVSNSTDFTGATEVAMSLNGTEWETTYDFTDGQYFTFATNDACVSVAPLLTTYGVTTNAAVDKCYVDGWILFKDPVDATKYIAGIYDPAALIDRTKITATVNVSSAYADLGKGNSTNAARLMRRMLQLDCASCFDAVANPTPNFTVRMFYNSTEKTDAESVETNNMESIKTTYGITDAHYFKWFKASGKSVSEVTSGLTASGGIAANGQEWFDGTLATGDIGGVEYVEFPNINSFSTFGGIWAVNLNTVLPVTWLGVQAVPVDNQKVLVKWSTASEQGNAGFDVQRSENGQNFTTIGHVAGSGTTTNVSHYSVEDNQVEQGRTYYYRIRQTDYNGHISYSITVSARLQTEGMTILVSPNPANHSSKVLITVNRQQVMQVMLTNISGQVLNSSKVIAQRGLNTHTLDLSRYSDGTYFIRVVADDGTVDTKKIIVQKTH